MTTVITGDTGVSQCSPASVSADDLQTGVGVITNGALASVPGAGLTVGSIPAGVKRITAALNGVSNSNTTSILLRLGTAGGLVTTGYVVNGARQTHSSTSFLASETIGISIATTAASDTVYGVAEFFLVDVATNLWMCNFQGMAASGVLLNTFGMIALSGPVTQLAVVPYSGSIDAGTVSVAWEF